jgi:hypothetical protein
MLLTALTICQMRVPLSIGDFVNRFPSRLPALVQAAAAVPLFLPRAHGAARALDFSKNRAERQAKATYREFFTLWKDADPMFRLKEAKSRYAKLRELRRPGRIEEFVPGA